MSKSKKYNRSRRKFIKTTAIGAAAISLSAKSYNRILGANDRINFAVVGVNGRGKALVRSALEGTNTQVTHICDVDSRAVEETIGLVMEIDGTKTKGIRDFRALMDINEVDAVAIASPDHWHASMAIMSVRAGKDVYVEKPSAHNPHEGEMMVKAQEETGKVMQVGTQQRSAPTTKKALEDIKDGIIGNAYFAKCWYSNTRGTIGRGKLIPVPEWLDWELWQGPAPRKAYKDNVVHYNWHWFTHWGTGEIHNNGTHEIDVCRLALGVDFPTKVSLNGGRYHFDDDWEFYDTQVLNFEFEDNKLITWESKSCNGLNYHDRGRGVTVHGTEGSLFVDRNDYMVFDLRGKMWKHVQEKDVSATTDVVGLGALDKYHMENFLNAIRHGEKLTAPIQDAHITNMLCHYGNMSQFSGTSLEIDPKTSKVTNNEIGKKMWSREYEPGWEV